MSKTVCPTSSVKNWSPCFRTGRESLVDDPRLGQGNAVITVDLIDKVDDLVRSDCHVSLRMLSALEQCEHFSRQITLSKSVRTLASEATHWQAKGIEYVDRTSTSVTLS